MILSRVFIKNVVQQGPCCSSISTIYEKSQRFLPQLVNFHTGSALPLQKINIEANKVQPSVQNIEKEILKKFGSRLDGWDPKQTNDGKISVIYDGMLKQHIKHLKIFSFSTSAIGIYLQITLAQKLEESSTAALVAVFGIVGFFSYVSPILIHLLAKRYVTEISYDPQEDVYTANTYSFFLQKQKLIFNIEDVEVPSIPGMLTTILVKKNGKRTPLFIVDSCFHDINHFGRLMGYDKPIDLGMDINEMKAAIERRKKDR